MLLPYFSCRSGFDVQETQVPIEPRHSNIVLKHFATENIKMAEKVLAAVTSGQVAAFNAASFECLAEVMLHRLASYMAPVKQSAVHCNIMLCVRSSIVLYRLFAENTFGGERIAHISTCLCR